MRSSVVLPAPFGPEHGERASGRNVHRHVAEYRALAELAPEAAKLDRGHRTPGSVARSSRRWTEVASAIRLRLSQPASDRLQGALNGFTRELR